MYADMPPHLVEQMQGAQEAEREGPQDDRSSTQCPRLQPSDRPSPRPCVTRCATRCGATSGCSCSVKTSGSTAAFSGPPMGSSKEFGPERVIDTPLGGELASSACPSVWPPQGSGRSPRSSSWVSSTRRSTSSSRTPRGMRNRTRGRLTAADGRAHALRRWYPPAGAPLRELRKPVPQYPRLQGRRAVERRTTPRDCSSKRSGATTPCCSWSRKGSTAPFGKRFPNESLHRAARQGGRAETGRRRDPGGVGGDGPGLPRCSRGPGAGRHLCRGRGPAHAQPTRPRYDHRERGQDGPGGSRSRGAKDKWLRRRDRRPDQ